MARLVGKRVVITGAGSGIGRATARLFAAEGALVIAADINSSGVEETASDSASIEAVVVDVSDEQAMAGLVSHCVDTHGGIDVIYANAGISGGRTPLFEQSVEEWEKILRVNLIAPFLAIKHAAPHMIRQGQGAIICTASVAGLRANAGGTPYSASKAGVVSLAQTVAYQLYGTGVRINAICPGLIETGMTRPIFDTAREKGTEHRIGQLNPTRRNGEPEEIANMALFLASDEASYVNGQAFAVDGGLSSSHPWVYPRD
ncbi:MAG: SDR family oxidoreductase [Gammaproteobacteria bacterium]|nr:SDR family oxidoreductase [Gammaproteobacteria bacterium]